MDAIADPLSRDSKSFPVTWLRLQLSARRTHRLYTDTDVISRIRNQFDGDTKIYFHFAPPFLSRIDPTTGEPRKRRFGPWIVPLLKLMSKLSRLRGTPMDVFGYTRERKMELIAKLSDDGERAKAAETIA